MFITEGGVLRRAIEGIAASWHEFVHRDDPLGGVHPDLVRRDQDRVRAAMQACLAERADEGTVQSSTAELGRAYAALSPRGKAQFLELLATFDVDRLAVADAVDALQHAPEGTYDRRLRSLRDATRAPWLTILRQFNRLPSGTKFLVDVRADLLDLETPSDAARRMDRDLRDLLASWFDFGFLELRRITWDASAVLLERIGMYEAVHEVRSWLDLKDRLDTDRRCYAYLHPAMPNEPLIFVEVALVREMSDRIAPLLDANAPRGEPNEATAAVFYSISNCQRGLAGVSFGNALIKRVVERLASEFPRIRTFATLSPIPGFRAWLDAGEHDAAVRAARDVIVKRGWQRDPANVEAVQRPLLRACARYLLHEKAQDGGARDPVARFHLSNGARLERLDWLADTSPKALRDSAGMMVNYVYRPGEIDGNRSAYLAAGTVSAAKSLHDLAKG